jgi:sialic acid synthase SpsE
MKKMHTEIIAEIGQNHNGDMDLAKKLIMEAKIAGADVAKFQVYDAKKLFPPKDLNPWFDYNCKTELKKQDVFRLHEYCSKVGIEFMASVFDLERLEWLEEIGVKRYKVASRSIYDEDLIKGLVATSKPLIISLGYWKNKDFPSFPNNVNVDFLYCISKYPTPLSDLGLSKVNFNKYAGFSDHSEGISASCASFVLGSRILEKHLTLDRTAFGPDHAGSMTPDELLSINIFRNDWQNVK